MPLKSVLGVGGVGERDGGGGWGVGWLCVQAALQIILLSCEEIQ